MEFKPAERMLAVELLDGEEDADDERIDSGDIDDMSEHNALIAVVKAVGPSVKVFKSGNTILVRPYARFGPRHGDVVFVEDFAVVAAVAG